jgi:DNA-binding transcriptional MerR regulator
VISRLPSTSRRIRSHEGAHSRSVRELPGTDAGAADEDSEAPGAGAHSAIVIATVLAARRRGRGGGGGSGGGSGGSSRKGLLSEDELRAVETEHAEGISAVQIVDIFTARGIRFSEATFRKYVQQGLLQRSKRVGRKGKHRGSMGVYPAKTVRRINAIKRLMGEGYTIEEIQDQFLRFSNVVESIEENLDELWSRLDDELARPHYDNRTRRSLEKQIGEARETADELMRRLDDVTRRVTAPRGEQARGTGAAGSAEDLL